jgi:hypothetical protein
MSVGRPANQGRSLVRGHNVAILLQHFDLSGFDQFLERGTLQSVVGDLTSACQPEVQSLAAG